MHFFVILRAGRLFFFIGQLYYFTQLPAGKSQASWYDFTSWWNKKFLPAGKIVPACKMQSCCQLAGIRWVWYHCLLQWLSTCMARLAFHSPQQNVAARIALNRSVKVGTKYICIFSAFLLQQYSWSTCGLWIFLSSVSNWRVAWIN